MDKPTISNKSVPLFGILNAQGDFWTPRSFPSEEAARQHIRDFWGRQTDQASKCLRTHRIVPVRVRMTLAPVDRAREARRAAEG